MYKCVCSSHPVMEALTQTVSHQNWRKLRSWHQASPESDSFSPFLQFLYQTRKVFCQCCSQNRYILSTSSREASFSGGKVGFGLYGMDPILVKNSRISNYHVGNREVLDKCFWLDSEGSRMIYWKSHLIVTVPLAISDDVKQQSLITTFVNLQDLIAVLVKIDSFVDRSRCNNEKYLDLISCLTCSRITIHYC